MRSGTSYHLGKHLLPCRNKWNLYFLCFHFCAPVGDAWPTWISPLGLRKVTRYHSHYLYIDKLVSLARASTYASRRKTRHSKLHDMTTRPTSVSWHASSSKKMIRFFRRRCCLCGASTTTSSNYSCHRLRRRTTTVHERHDEKVQEAYLLFLQYDLMTFSGEGMSRWWSISLRSGFWKMGCMWNECPISIYDSTTMTSSLGTGLSILSILPLSKERWMRICSNDMYLVQR